MHQYTNCIAWFFYLDLIIITYNIEINLFSYCGPLFFIFFLCWHSKWSTSFWPPSYFSYLPLPCFYPLAFFITFDRYHTRSYKKGIKENQNNQIEASLVTSVLCTTPEKAFFSAKLVKNFTFYFCRSQSRDSLSTTDGTVRSQLYDLAEFLI